MTPQPEPTPPDDVQRVHVGEPARREATGAIPSLVASRAVPGRMVSIDALRGFDMFWIIGGDQLATALCKLGPWPALAAQFEHVQWEGFRFYDLIFPLFLFLVGCVLPFSLEKYRAQPMAAFWRIARRVVVLFLLGMICMGLLTLKAENIYFNGVLQRIGLCYGAAAAIYLNTSVRGRVLCVAAILLAYWAILAWVPAPGGVAGDLSMEKNLAGYLDRHYLPGQILEEYYGHGANEGLLSTLPAIATTLLGVLAGERLRSQHSPWMNVGGLAGAGLACLAVGYVWGMSFPIIKNLWTSSFVLVSGGWSMLLLALFYALIDVLLWRRCALFFVVIGVNAITIYVALRLIAFDHTAEFVLGGVARQLGSTGPVLLAVGVLAVEWLFLWHLYRQKIFLRV